MKRLFDIVLALVVFVAVLPVMAIVALLIKFESKGPAIFKQERVGRYGHSFHIYKFRSMVVDAASQGPHFTSSDDPRITRIGCFIRKTSLDELPQLFNVFNGDMSLVGPRPNVPKQRTEYDDSEWDKRNSVRPGITGLAQAKLRSAATAEQRKAMDLKYVENTSLFFDVWIILLTVKQVIVRGGN